MSRALVAAAVEAVTAPAAEREQHVTFAGGDLPPLRGHSTRLRQAIDNLLQNAMRYTPRGGRIDVSAGLAPGGVYVRCATPARAFAARILDGIFEPRCIGARWPWRARVPGAAASSR